MDENISILKMEGAGNDALSLANLPEIIKGRGGRLRLLNLAKYTILRW